jgi:hypothetical protein
VLYIPQVPVETSGRFSTRFFKYLSVHVHYLPFHITYLIILIMFGKKHKKLQKFYSEPSIHREWWLLGYLMFCWPFIIVYQYRETNVMYFVFNLLRIKDLYMFRALLAHPQETLYKRLLVYCVRVMSVGYTRLGVVQATDITFTLYTKCCLWSASWRWASNARNM